MSEARNGNLSMRNLWWLLAASSAIACVDTSGGDDVAHHVEAIESSDFNCTTRDNCTTCTHKDNIGAYTGCNQQGQTAMNRSQTTCTDVCKSEVCGGPDDETTYTVNNTSTTETLTCSYGNPSSGSGSGGPQANYLTWKPTSVQCTRSGEEECIDEPAEDCTLGSGTGSGTGRARFKIQPRSVEPLDDCTGGTECCLAGLI